MTGKILMYICQTGHERSYAVNSGFKSYDYPFPARREEDGGEVTLKQEFYKNLNRL